MEAAIIVLWLASVIVTIGVLCYAIGAGWRWMITDRPTDQPQERREPRISREV
jgi:hypothetical protein